MEIFLTSLTAFASTNIDDLFILTLFFGNKKIKQPEIIAGQFLGIVALIAVSLLGSLIGLVVDPAYIGILGLVPIYLGLKGMSRLIKRDHQSETSGHVKTEGNKEIYFLGRIVAS